MNQEFYQAYQNQLKLYTQNIKQQYQPGYWFPATTTYGGTYGWQEVNITTTTSANTAGCGQLKKMK